MSTIIIVPISSSAAIAQQQKTRRSNSKTLRVTALSFLRNTKAHLKKDSNFSFFMAKGVMSSDVNKAGRYTSNSQNNRIVKAWNEKTNCLRER